MSIYVVLLLVLDFNVEVLNLENVELLLVFLNFLKVLFEILNELENVLKFMLF